MTGQPGPSARPATADDTLRGDWSAKPSMGRLSGQLPHDVPGSGWVATEAGRYLRAAARDDTPVRFGSPAGEVDDAARQVWKTAFSLLVRRRFDRDSPLAEISRTVATAVREHAVARLHPLDAEMLVRDALGEDVPLDGIEADIVVAVHLLMSATLTEELALGDSELDTIVAEAEKAAALVLA